MGQMQMVPHDHGIPAPARLIAQRARHAGRMKQALGAELMQLVVVFQAPAQILLQQAGQFVGRFRALAG